MKRNLMATGLALALTAGFMSSGANAAGCLKGAAVGGVAGHFAGHHGLLGAGAGCVIGHHEASKHAREQATQNQGSGTSETGTGGQGAGPLAAKGGRAEALDPPHNPIPPASEFLRGGPLLLQNPAAGPPCHILLTI